MIVENDIVNLAQIYAEAKGLSLSTVSTYACGDGLFLGGLQVKKSVTLRRAVKLTKWFLVNWPKDVVWPKNIPMPQLTEEDRITLKHASKREAARLRKQTKPVHAPHRGPRTSKAAA